MEMFDNRENPEIGPIPPRLESLDDEHLRTVDGGFVDVDLTRLIIITLREALDGDIKEVHWDPQATTGEAGDEVLPALWYLSDDGGFQRDAVPHNMIRTIVAQLKMACGLLADETVKGPQEGSFRTTYDGTDYTMIVRTHDSDMGEGVRVRMVPRIKS